MTDRGFDGVAPFLKNEATHRYEMAIAINNITRGKFNATLNITLRPNELTTTIVDPRIFSTSYIALSPLSANASTVKTSGIWFSDFRKGQCTINHASNASLDLNYRALIIG